MTSRRALTVVFLLALTGCDKVTVKAEGDTLIARPGTVAPVAGVAAGVGIVAIGVLVAREGKSRTKRIAGGMIFCGAGILFAVFAVMSYGRAYVRADGNRIVQAETLFSPPKTIDLNPLAHVSVHRVRRQRRGGGPKRRWVTLFWLHRPDGTIDEVGMSGDLNRAVRDHVLAKLAERGVRVEDLRDQAE